MTIDRYERLMPDPPTIVGRINVRCDVFLPCAVSAPYLLRCFLLPPVQVLPTAFVNPVAEIASLVHMTPRFLRPVSISWDKGGTISPSSNGFIRLTEIVTSLRDYRLQACSGLRQLGSGTTSPISLQWKESVAEKQLARQTSFGWLTFI